MKRALFWALFAAAYYLAAMYRSQPLMAFCLGMLLLAMASFVQSRLLRKGLSVTFPHGLQTVVFGGPRMFSVQIANACPLGAGYCSLTIRAAYARQAGPGDTIRLKAMAKQGEKQLCFSLSAPYCGLLLFRLDRLAVWRQRRRRRFFLLGRACPLRFPARRRMPTFPCRSGPGLRCRRITTRSGSCGNTAGGTGTALSTGTSAPEPTGCG